MAFNQWNKNHLIARLDEALAAAKTMPVDTPCECCAYCDYNVPKGTGPLCRMAGVPIPDEIRQKGCESYAFDPTAVPF